MIEPMLSDFAEWIAKNRWSIYDLDSNPMIWFKDDETSPNNGELSTTKNLVAQFKAATITPTNL